MIFVANDRAITSSIDVENENDAIAIENALIPSAVQVMTKKD